MGLGAVAGKGVRVGADRGRGATDQGVSVAANCVEGNDGQCNEGCGQHNPVDGHGAAFVLAEAVDEFRHGLSPLLVTVPDYRASLTLLFGGGTRCNMRVGFGQKWGCNRVILQYHHGETGHASFQYM